MDKIVRARGFRRQSTPAERLLWAQLRDRRLGGFKFRRQRSIGPYFVDFVCLERKLVIEVDGETHEFTMERDAARDATLRAAGHRVLRFRNDDVRGNLEGVRLAILNVLESDLSPSP